VEGGGTSFAPFVSATYSDGGEQLMSGNSPSFRSENGARKWLAKFMERMYSRTGTFSRTGKTSMAQGFAQNKGDALSYINANINALLALKKHPPEMYKGQTKGNADIALEAGQDHIAQAYIDKLISREETRSLRVKLESAYHDALGNEFHITLHSRSGVKSLMQKEYILWGVPEGETDQIHAKVLSTQAKTPSEMDEIKRRASAAGWHSFRVQILDPDKPTRMFSRTRSNDSSRFDAGRSSSPQVFSVEQPAYDDSWRTSKKTPLVDGYTAKERKQAMDDYRFAVSEEDRYMGSVFVTPSGQRQREETTRAAYLRAKKLNPNYQGFSRSGKETFEAGDSFMVEGYVGEMLTGGRSARTMEEAEHYASAMLAQIKRGAGGKPVKVEIQEVKDYSPQGVVKTLNSRSDDPVTNMVMKLKSKIARQTPREGTENFHKQVLRELDSILFDIKDNTRNPEREQLDMTDVKSRLQAMAPRGSAVMRELDSWAGFAREQSEISTRFGSIASKLGFLPDSITESNGVATLKFAQADGSAGRCAFAMISPLTGIVASDCVTATDTEVRVQFARAKSTFGSDVILEDIGDDQVRATARVEGRSAGSFDGPRSDAAQLLLKALKIAGQGHEVSSGVYDMTYIKLNDAARRAMPKSAMKSFRGGGKVEFAHANQQIADGVAQLLSVLGFAAMAEEAKTTTDADTLKRYINVARRRIKGNDQSDRFNDLADKLERMLMSRGGSKADKILNTQKKNVELGNKVYSFGDGWEVFQIPIHKQHAYMSVEEFYLISPNGMVYVVSGMDGAKHSHNMYTQWEKAVAPRFKPATRNGPDGWLIDMGSLGGYAKNSNGDLYKSEAEARAAIPKFIERMRKSMDKASRKGAKVRFGTMDEYTHRHLLSWIDSQLGNRAGSAGYIADKMIGTFNDDPEHWADKGWNKVFDAAGLSSADFNNPKKGWD